MSNIIDLSEEKYNRALNDISSQVNAILGEDIDKSIIVKGISDAIEISKLCNICDVSSEKKLEENHGIKPTACKNIVCAEYNSEKDECGQVLTNAVNCLYRMTSNPPNSLCYDEYMPSHQEALDRLCKNNLLKGDEYEQDQPRYDRAKTQAERGLTEVKGITMNAIEQCIKESLSWFIDYWQKEDGCKMMADDIDLDVISRNTCNNIEREMGIYPNIKSFR